MNNMSRAIIVNMQPYSSCTSGVQHDEPTVHGEITGGRVQLTTSRVLIMHPERLGGFWPKEQVPRVHDEADLTCLDAVDINACQRRLMEGKSIGGVVPRYWQGANATARHLATSRTPGHPSVALL